MFGRKPRVKCFNATYGAASFSGRADLGLQLVPVDKIVGSVGRCEELDPLFRPYNLTGERRQRLERIRRLVEDGHILPPVELYRLKDEYFVIDGNHRVAVAKENKQGDIEAHVIEFLPDGQSAEDQLYLQRREFVRETGLEAVQVQQLGGYARLREEITMHQAALQERRGSEVTVREAAKDWYQKIYRPVEDMLLSRRLHQRAGRSAGDLYLDLGVQRAHVREHEGRLPPWDEMVTRLEAQHPRPTFRQALTARWQQFWENLRASLSGRREDDLPCTNALLGPDGGVYCRRAARAKRGIFSP